VTVPPAPPKQAHYSSFVVRARSLRSTSLTLIDWTASSPRSMRHQWSVRLSPISFFPSVPLTSATAMYSPTRFFLSPVLDVMGLLCFFSTYGPHTPFLTYPTFTIAAFFKHFRPHSRWVSCFVIFAAFHLYVSFIFSRPAPVLDAHSSLSFLCPYLESGFKVLFAFRLGFFVRLKKFFLFVVDTFFEINPEKRRGDLNFFPFSPSILRTCSPVSTPTVPEPPPSHMLCHRISLNLLRRDTFGLSCQG